MGKKRMPKSVRKFIRKEKARIRREILDIKEQEGLISELYQKLQRKPVPAASSKKDIKNKQPVVPSSKEAKVGANQKKD